MFAKDSPGAEPSLLRIGALLADMLDGCWESCARIEPGSGMRGTWKALLTSASKLRAAMYMY